MLVNLASPAQIVKLGDLNHDNQVNITDIMALVEIVLQGYSPFSVSPTEIAMQAGGTAKLTIYGGYYYYEVESANPSIVEASVDGMTITLSAITGGETTVTVKDVLTFRSIDIPVVVEHNALQLSTTELSLVVGEQGNVEIPSGSGYYSVQNSDDEVVSAAVSGNTVTVTAVGAGTANITITDIKTDLKSVIHVTVLLPLSLSSSSIYITIGEEKTVTITTGSGNYIVQSNDVDVATATLDGDLVVISAIDEGTATITVTDTISGQSALIDVMVSESPMSFLTCPDTHHPHIIDLGLPSGTKWACCNVGASAPQETGGYYAWGESEQKPEYDYDNYILCDGAYDACYDIGSSISGTQYDTAHNIWGSLWRMPTYVQINELINNCKTKVISSDGNRLMQFTGPLGNSIILPFSGYFGTELHNTSSHNSLYWTGDELGFALGDACCFFSQNNGLVICDGSGREIGLQIRPVYTDTTPLIISLNCIEIPNGHSSTIPILSGSGSYTVELRNSDEVDEDDIATTYLSDDDIKIIALKEGIATIIVKDLKSGEKALLELVVTDGENHQSLNLCPDDNHPHMIDLDLPSGTKWACCNVDAVSPEGFGGYYSWGETEEKSDYSWDTYAYCDGIKKSCYDLGNSISNTQYDVAHVKWGDSWRMATSEEADELTAKCSKKVKIINGTKGMLFTGTNDKSIFLPFAGYRLNRDLYHQGDSGYSWLDSIGKSYNAPSLWANHFMSDFIFLTYRFIGRAVRPVSK